MTTLEIEILEERLTLHPYGSVWLASEQTLLIADPHFGKVNDFRKNGLAVPNALKEENYQKLNELIQIYNPRNLVFLGDLYHNARNLELEDFIDWSNGQDFQQTLILGNHDRFISKHLHESKLDIQTEMFLGSFYLTHHPVRGSDQFNICGHVHPSLVLRGSGGLTVKSTCFVQHDNQLILPAFGTFTGTHKVKLKDCLHVYMNVQDEVIQVK